MSEDPRPTYLRSLIDTFHGEDRAVARFLLGESLLQFLIFGASRSPPSTGNSAGICTPSSRITTATGKSLGMNVSEAWAELQSAVSAVASEKAKVEM